ncbi:MAG: type II secretion system F family protein [Bacilli bacterium]|nr:type II secretion system F family protein [Bacilli bacterium]
MEKYEFVLHTAALLLILFVLYLVYKYIMGYLKFRRLHEFSINSKNDKSYEVSFVYDVIFKFSKFLKSLVIFNGVADSYNVYLNQDSKFKSGMDYISIKIILGILFDILYVFSCSLHYGVISVFSMFVLFLLGFFSIDVAFYFKYNKNMNIMSDDILKSIIIMNNSFKANRNVEQALNDVVSRVDGPIRYEFKKIVYDLKLGFTIGEAFKRMYLRTRLDVVLEISYILSLANKSGNNVVAIFEDCEKRLLDDESVKNKIKSFRKVNMLYYVIFMLMPIFVTVFIFANNIRFLNMFQGEYGILIFVIFVFMYTSYLIILRNVARRNVI